MGAPAYIHVKNFKAGMSRGGSRLSTEAGSLWTLTNGHLDRNGDVIGRKKFVSKFTVPSQTFGLHANGDVLYTFGSADVGASVPVGITYQRLQHPDGSTAMSALLATENFDGKIYAIADFADGDRYHFYDGALVADWLNGIVRDDMTDNDGIAEHLRALIDANANFSATRLGAVVTITGSDTGSYTAATVATNGGATDDQTLVAATTQTAIAAVAAVAATATFSVTGGTNNTGVNTVASVTSDGIEIMNTAEDWVTSNSQTASNVSDEIDTFNSTPEYTADAIGPDVTISASVAGVAANGRTLTVTPAGDVTVGSITNFAGGVDAETGRSQIVTVTVGGTFEAGDKFTVKLTKNGVTHIFGADGSPSPVGKTLQTFQAKLYSTVSSILHFCGVERPTGWNRDDINNPGANFINMSTKDQGSATLYGTEIYQGSMAVFARRVIQIWQMDPDEDLNVFLQSLKNTGSRSGGSILAFGNNDVFYLSDVGIRSLRARDSSNSAHVNDVGNAIDPFVTAFLDTLTDTQIENAVAILEPENDRYWLALGQRVFVFSFFPGSKVSAWSYYDVSTDIGGDITDWARTSNRIYVRSGATVYLYGGDSNAVFPDADEAPVTVEFPWLDAGTPAHQKKLRGLHIGARGVWDAEIYLDPDDDDDTPVDKVIIGAMVGTTYGQGRQAAEHQSTHFAPKLVASRGGEVRLMSIAVVYDDLHEPGGAR